MTSSTCKRGILVLGMHRSGTSAATRLINLLGAGLPRDLIPAAADNPTGFWESVTITQINDALLATRGADWHSDFRPPADFLQQPAVRALREKAASFLRAEFADAQSFVLKDPRMCRLVPFWLAVLDDVNADAAAVLVVRPPDLVAKSLRARNRMARRKSRRLWLDHILPAELATRHIPRIVLSFDELLADPVRATERAATAVGLDLAAARDGWQADVREFIGTDLARQSSVWHLPARLLGGLRPDQAVYRRLIASPDGKLSPSARDFLDMLARRRQGGGQSGSPRPAPASAPSRPEMRGHLVDEASPGLRS